MIDRERHWIWFNEQWHEINLQVLDETASNESLWEDLSVALMPGFIEDPTIVGDLATIIKTMFIRGLIKKTKKGELP